MQACQCCWGVGLRVGCQRFAERFNGLSTDCQRVVKWVVNKLPTGCQRACQRLVDAFSTVNGLSTGHQWVINHIAVSYAEA